MCGLEKVKNVNKWENIRLVNYSEIHSKLLHCGMNKAIYYSILFCSIHVEHS